MPESESQTENRNEHACSRSPFCTQLCIDKIGGYAVLHSQSLLRSIVIVALPPFRSKMLRSLRRSIRIIPKNSTRPVEISFMPTLIVVNVVVERYKTNAAIIIDAVQSRMNLDMVRLILRVTFRPESLMTASSSVVLERL